MHILEITSDPEFGRECEVTHEPDCPTAMHHHGYMYWKCQVGWYLDEFGLPEELTTLEPGEYPIEFWVESHPNYNRVMEYDYGLALVDPQS